MTALSRVTLPRSTDLGKAGPSRDAPHTGEIGDFVGIKMYLSHGVARTHEDRTLAVDAAAGGGRISAISRGLPANGYGGMATAAIWNVT
jgi:hypothetical protein